MITVDDVMEFLMIHVSPNDTPDTVNRIRDWIQNRINENVATLEDICKTTWGTPKERTDIINNARLITWRGRLSFLIYVRYKPVTEILELKVNIAGTWRDITTYELVHDRGAIYVPVQLLDMMNQWHKWQIRYKYGHPTVPADIRGALIRMVAIDVVNTQYLHVLIPNTLDFKSSIQHWQSFVNNVISRYANLNVLT